MYVDSHSLGQLALASKRTASNISVSEPIPVCAARSSGTAQSYRAPRCFGCREIKVPSTPIFFLIYVALLLLQTLRLFLTY